MPINYFFASFHTVEDLIALTESVAQSLNQGDVSYDLLNKMFINLQMHGAQLEIYSKEILDRCFNVFRNASQDDRLKISVRLNLLNLIELRANSWINKCADYYKSKANEVRKFSHSCHIYCLLIFLVYCSPKMNSRFSAAHRRCCLVFLQHRRSHLLRER